MSASNPLLRRRHRRLLVEFAGGGGTLLVSDSFNRANNAASLGSTDGGSLSPLAWTALGGTYGITSNAAAQTTASPAYHAAVVNTGVADVTVQATLTAVDAAGGLGLALRATDDNNFLYFEAGGGTAFTLFKRVAGAFTSLGSFSQTPANGDIVKVVCLGSSYQCYVNGILRVSAADAFNATAVSHGIATNSLAGRFDDFSVRA